MFQQVFICCDPEDEKDTSASVEMEDVNESSGPKDYGHEVKNTQIRNEQKMEVDVPTNTGELVQSLSIKTEICEENNANQEILLNFGLPQDNEEVNVQIKNEKKIEVDIPSNTSEVDHSLNLNVQSINFPEENKAHSEVFLSQMLPENNKETRNSEIKSEKTVDVDDSNIELDPLNMKSDIFPGECYVQSEMAVNSILPGDDEVLNSTFDITSTEECGNFEKTSSNKNKSISDVSKNAHCDKQNSKIFEDFNHEKIISNRIKGKEIKSEIKPNVLPKDNISPASKCTQNRCDENIDDSAKVMEGIDHVNRSVPSLLIKKRTERISLPPEEDSGSDWEQEYFASTNVKLRKKSSKKSSKQDVNTTFPEKTILLDKRSVTKIYPLYPVKVFSVSIQPHPVVIHALQNKVAINRLKKKVASQKNVQSSRGSNKINQKKNIQNNKVNIHPGSVKPNNQNKLCIRPYKCSDCDKCFRDKPSVRAHRRYKHPKALLESDRINKPYKCSDCETFFSKKCSIRGHIKLKHPEKVLLENDQRKVKINKMIAKSATGSGQFICNVCHKYFQTRVLMRRHLRTLCFGFKRSQNCQCDICGKCFPGEDKLHNHRNTHTNAKPFKCVECDKYFNTKGTRWFHYRKVHMNIPDPIYLCSFCGITSQSISHMLAHEEVHRLPEGAECPTPFKCVECGRGYISKHKLNNHKRKQHGVKKCSLCSETFKSRNSLRKHRQEVHNIFKFYKCEVCERTFDSCGKLKSHSSVHSTFKFFCDICDKGFKLKTHIKQHMITHSDERPLTCPYCGDRFKRKTHLNQHVSAIHGKGEKR